MRNKQGRYVDILFYSMHKRRGTWHVSGRVFDDFDTGQSTLRQAKDSMRITLKNLGYTWDAMLCELTIHD